MDNGVVRVSSTSNPASTVEGLQLTALASGAGKYLPAITWGYGVSSPDFSLIEASRGSSIGGRLHIKTATTAGTMSERLRIDESGDISFYEDTGTTPKFFWDANAERLGIGTNSPRADLSVYQGSATDDFNLLVTTFRPNIVLEDMSTNASDWQLFADGGDLQFRYGDASTDTKLANEAMRIDNSGNVGIGTSSPAQALDVQGATGDNSDVSIRVKAKGTGDSDANVILDAADTGEAVLAFYQDGVSKASINWFQGGSPDLNISTEAGTNGVIDLQPNNSLAMRIASNGNVGIGKANPPRS